MRAIKPAFLAGVVLLASLAFGRSKPAPTVSLPDWMQQAIAAPAGTYADDTNAVVLLKSHEIIVDANGDYVEHDRRVVRILRTEGSNEAKLAVYLQGTESAEDIHAWSTDGSGHNFEIKSGEFQNRSPITFELYNDVRYLYAEAQAHAAGSVVGFEYTVRRHPFYQDLIWDPQEDIPVKSAEFLLSLPNGFEHVESWVHHETVKPQELTPNKLRWTQSEIAPITEEPMRPSFGSLESRLAVTYLGGPREGQFGSWAKIGHWYHDLVSTRIAATPEISAKAHELTAGKSSFDAKVRAIADFMQTEVRYVAVEIGIGGFQPHYAGEIFKHRYGDCKDKATVMIAMLHEIGIPAEYVLVHTSRGVVQESQPTRYFNHAILAVQLPADTPADAYPATVTTKNGTRYVIFDPTNEYVPFGIQPSYEQTSFGLLATDPGELVKFPLLNADLNRNETLGKFVLDADGTLHGEVAHRLTGDVAGRMRARISDSTDRTKLLETVASSSLKQASLEQPTFDHLQEVNRDLEFKYQLRMSNYAQNTAGLLLVRPRVIGDKLLHLPKKKRKYPVELRGTTHDHEVFEITLPDGYVVDELPDNVKIDVGFASYESKYEKSGNVLRYTRDYVVRTPEVPLDHYGDLQRLEGTIARDQFANAVLKKGQ